MRILLSALLVLVFAATSFAVPMKTAEMGTVPARTYSPTQEVCYIGYYNFCSGWVYYWSGYCYCLWCDTGLTPQYGTVFDLGDCSLDCRHLADVWWACKRFTTYGDVDVEIFWVSSDPDWAYHCPLGPALAGVYHYTPDFATAWQHFYFNELPLCVCDWPTHCFLVRITDHGCGVHTSPYSDINVLNIDAGCETEWRCEGHSYVYRNCVDYCMTYGVPGPMWVSGPGYGCTNYPLVPPGCHNYFYPTGFFTEFLIDVYVSCLGATATEQDSWSEIKALFK